MSAQKMSWSNLNPGSFAYGSLPFYLLFGAGKLLEPIVPGASSYDGMLLIGRVLSATISVATIAVAGMLAVQLQFSLFGVLAVLAFAAWNPFLIQNAHFYTVDTPLTFLCLLALLFMTRYLKKPALASLFGFSVCIGAATATKIAGLTLFLPAAIAIIVTTTGPWREKLPVSLKRGLFCGLIAAIVFFICEPFSLLDYTKFVHDIAEQAAMVRGDYVPPYTLQYVNTRAFIYPLEQMLRFTIGPLVFVLAIVGFCLAAWRGWREKEIPLLLIAAWSFAAFAAFGGQLVKFPRYFMIIYPAFFLFGGFALTYLQEKLTRHGRYTSFLLLVGLAGFELFRSLCFMTIYQTDHNWHSATRWIYENVPAKSLILAEHWDDQLPLSLNEPNRKSYLEGDLKTLALYEPDTETKFQKVADQLSQGAYMALATPRLYGSITQVPERYAITPKYYRLLFGGKLGYELVKTFRVQPSFLSFEFDDSLADESLLVYDHPKVVIFKNTGKKTSEEILKAIYSGPDVNVNRTDMMTAIAAPEQPHLMDLVPFYIFDTILWYFVVGLLGFCFWRIWLRSGFFMPDQGWGVSKTLGLATFAFSVWYLQNLTKASMTLSTVAVVGLALLIVVACELFDRKPFLPNDKNQRMRIFYSEIAFASVFGVCLFIKSWQPEIFWGEKPMDFTFLNFFARGPSIPAEDPWAAGSVMKYYYLGSYTFGLLCRILQTPGGIGYNISLAILPALSIAALVPLIAVVIKRWPIAVIASLVIYFGSNSEAILQLLSGERRLGFDMFWATSRIFKTAMANEYPLWSFLFGDLHAHVIATPLVVAFMVVIAATITSRLKETSINCLQAIILGLVLSLLLQINTWDFLSYGLITGIAIIALAAHNSWSKKSLINFAIFAGICGFVVATCSFPYVASLANSSGNRRYGVDFGPSNTVLMAFRHFGVFFAPLLLAFAFLIVGEIRQGQSRRSTRSWLSLLILGSVPALMAAFAASQGKETIPWDLVILATVIGGIGAWKITQNDEDNLQYNVLYGALALGISWLMMASELFWLLDHMNTLFKVLTSLWIPIGILTCGVATAAYKATERTLFKKIFAGAGVLIVLIMASNSLINLGVMTTFQRVPGPRPHLDGQAYMRYHRPDDFACVDWLNKNVKGTPVIMEAHGDPYREFTRISMNTGLPTVLGWPYHVEQRGLSPAEISIRKEFIKSVYESKESKDILHAINRFKVKYIVVGDIERQVYPGTNTEKFEHSELFAKVFETGRTAIYQIK